MHVHISDVDILYLQTHVHCDMQMHHNAHSSPTKIAVVVVGGVAWHGSSPWQADKQNDKRRSLIFNAVEIPCKIAKNLHTAPLPTPFQARVNAGDRVEYLGKCGRSRPTTATRRTTTTTMTAAQRSQSRQTRTMNKNNKNRREAKRREQQQWHQ